MAKHRDIDHVTGARTMAGAGRRHPQCAVFRHSRAQGRQLFRRTNAGQRHGQELLAAVSVHFGGSVVHLQEAQRLRVIHPHRAGIGHEQCPVCGYLPHQTRLVSLRTGDKQHLCHLPAHHQRGQSRRCHHTPAVAQQQLHRQPAHFRSGQRLRQGLFNGATALRREIGQYTGGGDVIRRGKAKHPSGRRVPGGHAPANVDQQSHGVRQHAGKQPFGRWFIGSRDVRCTHTPATPRTVVGLWHRRGCRSLQS